LMIVLTGSATLTASLNATATPELECIATYVDTDSTGTAFTEVSTAVIFGSTGATNLVGSPAANISRIIRYIAITNTFSAARTVTLRTQSRVVCTVTLQPNDTWTFNGTFDSTGSRRQSLANSAFAGSFSNLVRPIPLGTLASNPPAIDLSSPISYQVLVDATLNAAAITLNFTGLSSANAGTFIVVRTISQTSARNLTIQANSATTALWSSSGEGAIAGITSNRVISTTVRDVMTFVWDGTWLILMDDITRNASLLTSGTLDVANRIANSAVAYGKIQNVTATNRLLGRVTAGAGVIEELTVLPTATMPALTGDVTNSAGSLATTIANNAITTVKITDNNVTGAKLATLVAGDAPKLQAPVRAVTEAVFTIAANTASPALVETNGRMQTLTSNTGVTVSVTTLSDGNMILLRVIASAAITVNVPASSTTVKRSAGSISLATGEWVDISVTRMGTDYTWNIGGKLT
jgi:hypothetical protein